MVCGLTKPDSCAGLGPLSVGLVSQRCTFSTALSTVSPIQCCDRWHYQPLSPPSLHSHRPTLVARRQLKTGPEVAQSWPRGGPMLGPRWPKAGPEFVQCWPGVGPMLAWWLAMLARSWFNAGPELVQCWPGVGSMLAWCLMLGRRYGSMLVRRCPNSGP